MIETLLVRATQAVLRSLRVDVDIDLRAFGQR
jgi:hypothetical protein